VKGIQMDLSKIIKLLTESEVEVIVRLLSVIHNILAPGFIIIFIFHNDVFLKTSTAKLVLLSFCISIPIVYLLYFLLGNIVVREPIDPSDLKKKRVIRIQLLLNLTICIIFINTIIFLLPKTLAVLLVLVGFTCLGFFAKESLAYKISKNNNA
ncbi:MAG TPA: hypothetical protein VEP89_10145, partial [Draconibacterium sp.]|nr:hypothetical protein [Draconibacterium sp.]